MNDNFFFLFVDEIYSPNLQEFRKYNKESILERKAHHHFGLAGVIVPANSLVDLNFGLRRRQVKHCPNKKNPIVHYTDILHTRNAFSPLAKNKKKYDSLISSLTSWINAAEFLSVFSFVNKERLVEEYGMFNENGKLTRIKKIRGNIYPETEVKNYNLYTLSLKFLLVNFYTFLERKRARGVVVSETRDIKQDSDMRTAFDLFHRYGVSSISATDFRSLVIDYFTCNKYLNQAGLQLADLVLYPTYDATVPDHTPRTDHFINFESTISGKLYKGKESINIFPR